MATLGAFALGEVKNDSFAPLTCALPPNYFISREKIKGLAHPVTDADCLASCGLSAALLTFPSLGWVGLS